MTSLLLYLNDSRTNLHSLQTLENLVSFLKTASQYLQTFILTVTFAIFDEHFALFFEF